MKSIMLCLPVLLAGLPLQAQRKPPRILYYLDSVKVVDDPFQPHYRGQVSEDDVAYIHTRPARNWLKHIDEFQYDSIRYVFTKPYAARSEADRRIPSENMLDKRWANDMSTYYEPPAPWPKTSLKAKRYTGPVVNYHFNGRKESEGWIENGVKKGPFRYYDEDGRLRSFKTWAFEDGEQLITHADSAGTIYLSMRHCRKGISYDTSFYPNGRIQAIGFISPKHTLRTRYLSNGKMIDSAKHKFRYRVYHYGMFKERQALLNKYDYAGALRLDPGNPDIYMRRGYYQASRREYDAAILSLDSCIAIEPLMMENYGLRANIRLMKYIHGEQHETPVPQDAYMIRQHLIRRPLKNMPAAEKMQVMKDLEAASRPGPGNENYYELYRFLKKSNFLQ